MPPSLEDFARLYRRNARALIGFFEARVGSADEAADLLSETFALALERRDQARGTSLDALSGWIWSIAQSQLRDYERQTVTRRRRLSGLARERRSLTDTGIERVDELGEIEQLTSALERFVAELPADAQTAVRMRFLEERSYEDVARRLGISPAGARTLVSRSLRTLAARLRGRAAGS